MPNSNTYKIVLEGLTYQDNFSDTEVPLGLVPEHM